MEQIGYTLLDALIYEGSITTSRADLSVNADHLPDGTVYCWLKGGSGRDQAIFLRTLREVLRPIENPRYLLANGKFSRIFGGDYFAVPEILVRARTRSLASTFQPRAEHLSCWK
jgi:hypothetical protein